MLAERFGQPFGGEAMARKKTGVRKVTNTANAIRHARLELPDEDYERLKRVAKSIGLGVASYIRMAVLKQIRRDEADMEGGGE
jgi:hypothetical protein